MKPIDPLFATLLRTPLAILERAELTIAGSMQVASAKIPDFSASDKLEHDYYGNTIARPRVEDGIAIIPLHGICSIGLGPMGEYYGYTDTRDFITAVKRTVVDPMVRGVMIDIHSPGGVTIGGMDAAEAIAELSDSKPVAGFCSGIMASLAYWIGSACPLLMGMQSSMVGSIGTYLYLVDWSGLEAEFGIKSIVVRSGKLKGVGLDRITEEQLAMLQEEIDANGEEFRSYVEFRRSDVERSDMEGQVFSGHQALERGFLDGIAMNLEDAISEFRTITNI
ncbi:MAG: S49 family peptidase [Puniceicoccaceae bacterium]